MKIKFVYQFADPSVRSFIGDDIDNNSAIVCGFKEVLMLKEFKIAFDHFIGKCFIRFHLRDPGSEISCFKKMLAFPCHGIFFIDQARSDAADGFFFYMFHGYLMQADIPVQIKDDVLRRCNKGSQMKCWHDKVKSKNLKVKTQYKKRAFFTFYF